MFVTVSCKRAKLISHRICIISQLATSFLLLQKTTAGLTFIIPKLLLPFLPATPSLIVSNSDLWICTGTPHPHSPVFARRCIFCHSWTHTALFLPVLTCTWSQSVLTRRLFGLSSSGMTLKTSVSRVTHFSRRSFHQLLLAESLPLSPLHTLIALKSVSSLPPWLVKVHFLPDLT